ncbi:MAG: hypothetical protein QXR26_02330 [Candidatus Caldarchaeum sp.]
MTAADVEKGERSSFLSGHSVFDRIVWLRPGSTVLVADETFSEGLTFLRTLFRSRKDSVVEIASSRHQAVGKSQATVSIGSLQDLSIQVNQRRRAEKGKVFIHTYLPELLVRHNPDEVLKLLEIWQKDVSSSKSIEFYLLPRNTFGDFEKKVRAIVDSVIDISVVRSGSQLLFYMTPVRGCDPQFHLKNIQYEITGGRLLVEWKGALLEELPAPAKSVDEIKNELDSKADRLMIKVAEANPELMSISDYMLLTSMDGNTVSVVKHLFPEIWTELEEKIATWVVSGILNLEEVDNVSPMPRRKGLKLKSKLLLKVPASLAVFLVSLSKGFLGKRVRTVPLDAHLAVLEAMKKIVDYSAIKRAELRTEARLATYYFGQLSARKTALEYIKRLEGTYYTVFNVSDAPKLIAITLKAGWGLDIAVTAAGNNSWVFEVKRCHLCESVSSDSPYCDKFVSSVVTGVLAVCLKMKTDCFEISCRAMGAESCSFKTTIL